MDSDVQEKKNFIMSNAGLLHPNGYKTSPK